MKENNRKKDKTVDKDKNTINTGNNKDNITSLPERFDVIIYTYTSDIENNTLFKQKRIYNNCRMLENKDVLVFTDYTIPVMENARQIVLYVTPNSVQCRLMVIPELGKVLSEEYVDNLIRTEMQNAYSKSMSELMTLMAKILG